MQQTQGLEVVGLGNALVDALVQIDNDTVLSELRLTRGQMHPVDHDAWHHAFHRVQPFGVQVQSGGSCANTIATLGLLGAKACFAGQVGEDQMGHLYASRMEEACGGHALRFTREHSTGKCLAIISPGDAERTMLTDLGAAVLLPEIGHVSHLIASASVLHTEGYLLLGEPMKSRAREAVALIKAHGGRFSLDVSDPWVVHATRDDMEALIAQADIVFLNTEEAAALGGGQPEAAVARLSQVVPTVVLKLGARGSLIKHKGVLYPALAFPTTAVDTTGAGDAYAAGYLYGYLRDWSPQRSAALASHTAALAVSQIGAVVRDRALLQGALAAVGGAA